MTPCGVQMPGSGEVVICEHGNRRITRMEKNGTRTPLATHFNVSRRCSGRLHPDTTTHYRSCALNFALQWCKFTHWQMESKQILCGVLLVQLTLSTLPWNTEVMRILSISDVSGDSVLWHSIRLIQYLSPSVDMPIISSRLRWIYVRCCTCRS